MRAPLAIAFGILLVAGFSSAWAVCDPDKPSATPTTRYVLNGAEVLDRQTNLTWQRCSVGQRWQEGADCVGDIRQMEWNEAWQKEGKGWRVPTKDELATLISPTCKNPAINEEAFPGMEPDKLWYWASPENGTSFPANVDFVDGRFYGNNRGGSYALRLVRGGP